MNRTFKRAFLVLLSISLLITLTVNVVAEESDSTADNRPSQDRGYIQTYYDVPVLIYTGNGTPANIRIYPWVCPCFYQYWLQDANDVDLWYGQGNCNNYIDIYAGANVDEVWFQSTGGTVTVSVTH